MNDLPSFRCAVLRNGDCAHAIVDPLLLSVAPQRVRCIDVSDMPPDVVAVNIVGVPSDWRHVTPTIVRILSMVRELNGHEEVVAFSGVCPAIPLVLNLRIVPLANASMLFHQDPGLLDDTSSATVQ